MSRAIHQENFSSSIKFKTFSKYDFVKSYVKISKDEKLKAEKEEEAAIIADAIEETQAVLLENLATKEDLKREIKTLEHTLTIKIVLIVGGFLTVIPIITSFIKTI